MNDELQPARPGPGDLGRLNVAPSAVLPILTDCRWCTCELRVRRSAVYCPLCDRAPVATR